VSDDNCSSGSFVGSVDSVWAGEEDVRAAGAARRSVAASFGEL
jgi:hypothetical protein